MPGWILRIRREILSYSPNFSFAQAGVTSPEKVVPSVQVTVSLPLFRNSSSHVTVSSVPVFTGNVVSVLRLIQAEFRPVHCATSVSNTRILKYFTIIQNSRRCLNFFESN